MFFLANHCWQHGDNGSIDRGHLHSCQLLQEKQFNYEDKKKLQGQNAAEPCNKDCLGAKVYKLGCPPE